MLSLMLNLPLVAPRAGAWIETINAKGCPSEKLSHPVRVRGLKLKEDTYDSHYARSHPVRVRGLKPLKTLAEMIGRNVAPRAGAWIETILS